MKLSEQRKLVWQQQNAPEHYGFGHLRAYCRGPGSAPEPHARFEYGTFTLPYLQVSMTLPHVQNLVNISLVVWRGEWSNIGLPH